MNESLRLKADGGPFLKGEIFSVPDNQSPEVSHEAWGRVGEALAAALRKEGIPHRIEAIKGQRFCAVESRDLWPPAVYDEREARFKPKPPPPEPATVQLDVRCCEVFTRLTDGVTLLLERLHRRPEKKRKAKL